MWTHNHRLVKYMYMSMRRCDAHLQAVPNPYYCNRQSSGLLYCNTVEWSVIL